MPGKFNIALDLEITTTTIVGIAVITAGIVGIFLLGDASFAGNAITLGVGLCGAAKVCNTW
jgi:hypothetical protein